MFWAVHEPWGRELWGACARADRRAAQATFVARRLVIDIDNFPRQKSTTRDRVPWPPLSHGAVAARWVAGGSSSER
eukprot:7170318-Alexandrium_andersonii.AAC.1